MITVEEQIDYFLSKYSIELMDFLDNIDYILKQNCIPILNNKKKDYNNEFVELIMEFVDLKKLYLLSHNP
jgi:hypothetical protein